ncbi:hypothetical protein L873DRAFT_1808854 [Choiromyces venosus 120613-1]|uniref:Uncharacterized protein n=1 Tax=Choiromyces venosus 120613-1 TaxID=1336337 RepID=A0A3N4JIC3_9PEZI|nr:hypothetical protein L873DRAFT_1808854 [Choiromyces venosus 120613-1]
MFLLLVLLCLFTVYSLLFVYLSTISNFSLTAVGPDWIINRPMLRTVLYLRGLSIILQQ